ncbi:hypothetical protein JMG10_07535 [Nostoc ellipsosporum NOK]|nr:hypothetical protein [Nostoc ellipsosporum NOK]
MDQTTLEKDMAVVKRLIADIHHVVLGSEHEKDNGLLARVRDLEDRVEKQSLFQKKLVWVAVGMAAPASWGILEFFQKIVLK